MRFKYVKGAKSYTIGESFVLNIGQLAKKKSEEKFEKYSTEFSYGIFVKHTRILLDKLNLTDEQMNYVTSYIQENGG